MKIVDKVSCNVVAEIATNNSISIEDVLLLMLWDVDADGKIVDFDNFKPIEPHVYLENLEMVY